MNKPLTFADIESAYNKLKYETDFFGVKLIESNWLTGMQAVIISGDNGYYSPDITGGEVTIFKISEYKPDKEHKWG